MPSPTEILSHSASLTALAPYAAPIVWEGVAFARALPPVKGRRNGRAHDFAETAGFYDGASTRIAEMVGFRDVSVPR